MPPVQPLTARDRDARRSVRLEEHWRVACAKHLPVAPLGSVWRYSRPISAEDPDQGWKLHVSATILTAGRVLIAVAEELRTRGVLFKAPGTLSELHKLNCGYYYGASQIGKFLTVYPRVPDEAADLAARLDELTRGIGGPSVPFERPYRLGSRVFYRYGSFQSVNARFEGDVLPALRAPDGQLVPDERTYTFFEPSWCPSPFPAPPASRRRPSMFGTRYLVYESLIQRGKGGVYQALDMAEVPFKLCIVKEGRRHGETDWGGRDGRARVKTEAHVLRELASAGVRVPLIRDIFEEKRNLYLVLEYLGEQTLERRIRDAVVLPIENALELAAAMAALVGEVHESGWAWRDVKPRNIIVDDTGMLNAVDFEGACRPGARDVPPWGSEGYVPLEWLDPMTDHIKNDLFALGVSCYQILAGARSFGLAIDNIKKISIGRRRRQVPSDARRIVAALLDSNPNHRPRARAAAEAFAAAASRTC